MKVYILIFNKSEFLKILTNSIRNNIVHYTKLRVEHYVSYHVTSSDGETVPAPERSGNRSYSGSEPGRFPGSDIFGVESGTRKDSEAGINFSAWSHCVQQIYLS